MVISTPHIHTDTCNTYPPLLRRCACSRRGLSIACRCVQCSGDSTRSGSHLVVKSDGVTDAEVVQSIPQWCESRVILEVSIATIGSNTSLSI